ncbi:cobalt ECF transporter T component CbiQ [Sinosporangium siamense]|uniref:Cobalt ECF transporter T component CbiQ n=1 Tax=Sinosporangium siamense TaxID=1367973 RepID=A0A919V5S6_9ACTN|nr:cobalt ECF transporter T component CbiQ [Sinosporangium siamense]GII93330.1 cobalt ECF transporter T component CbiQ [Sinosporangium siamense]
MGAGHHHRLYRPGHTVVHRLPPQCKLLAVAAFAVVVVATPREWVWVLAAYGLPLGVVAATAHVPPGFVLRRMVIEAPFVAFAVVIPFIGLGERIDVFGVALSVEGLWASWNILAKATLGVVAAVLLAATTEPHMMLLGARRLRVPSLLVQIAMFMLRYMDVIAGEARRMRIARESRGFQARDLRHAPVIARSAGALFIRSYERGERVHLAMLSRGYTGSMPVTQDLSASWRQWAVAASLPGTALAVAAVGGTVGAALGGAW